ncbi:MAG: GatB/YqeY domain-containing protein [Syntrophobacteraceae bacterium]
MELTQHIDRALKEAIREKDENKRNAIRMLMTVIKVKEKELRRMPEEAEIQQLITSQIKQRRDAVEQFRAGGREDLAQNEEQEIAILQGFLPEQLSGEAVDALVDEAIAATGAASAKDMGKVMKALMPKVAGRVDGKQLNERVKQKLASLG